MRKTLNRIWFPFNVLLTAISLLNLGEDIYPAFVKWNEFISYLLTTVKHIRNFVLLPISFPLNLFGLELFDWVKSYLFLGLLTYNTYNLSHRVICGSFSHASLINLFVSKNKMRIAYHIAVTIILWPLFIFELVQHYYKGEQKNKHNVYTLWGKYLLWVAITSILLIFLNWIINQVN